MSMVVGNGIRFRTTDFVELHAQLAVWRQRLSVITLDKVATVFAQDATQKIDDAMAKGEIPDKALAGSYARFIDEQDKIKKTGVRNPRFDMDFEVSIFPYEGSIFGNIRCEHAEWIRQFKHSVGATSYAYWDNTDKDRNVTRAEWAKRGQMWDDIYCRSKAGINSFEAICTTPNHAWWGVISRKDVAKRVVSFESRLKRVASNNVRDRQMAVDPALNDGREKTHLDYSHAFFETQRWLGTEQGQTMVGIEIAHLRNLLAPEITEDML